MTARFLEIAELELDHAVQWYGAQARGLGDALLFEVLSAADRIARFPEAWHSLGEGVRENMARVFAFLSAALAPFGKTALDKVS